MADVYRWLRTGRTYTYRAAVGKGLDERRGLMCKRLTIGNGRGRATAWSSSPTG